MSSASGKIFIALRPEPLPMVQQALEGYDLVVAQDFDHAQKLITDDDEFDLFVIGILFDDSKAMELIKIIRLDPTKHNIPILVTRFMPSQYEDMLRRVLDTMKALNTVSDYLESDLSVPELKERVRHTVEKYLPVEKRVKPSPPRRKRQADNTMFH